MSENGHQAVILASASAARQRLLTQAGILFTAVPSSVDEGAIRAALLQGDDRIAGEDLSEVLARAKAQEVSGSHPGAVVIGGDQVLEFEDRFLEKAQTDDEVRTQLLDLRGATHTLHSSAVIAVDGEVVWAHADTAHVTMRMFSASFLGRYMAMAGREIRNSVGCYHLEGPGVQLIERVSGDYFTVLGLPLFPLLAELRERGVLQK